MQNIRQDNNSTNSTDNSTSGNSTLSVKINNITQPLIIIPEATAECNEKWNYDTHGGDWECICKDGNEQSPIDLPSKDGALLSPVRPVFNYNIINKDDQEIGKTIDQINYATTQETGELNTKVKIRFHNSVIKIISNDMGKLIKIDGSFYVAEEIQFHTPSEHTIEGERFDMEMQVIHYGRSQGDIAKQVVLSFLFKRKPGAYNKFIDSLDFFELPNPSSTIRDLYQNLFIPNVFYNKDDDDIPVMKPFSFYTYEGSLTFPPCTERTTWYVTANPIDLSSSAIDMFKDALRKPDMQDANGNVVLDNSSTENYRDTQERGSREVFIYDHEKYDCPEFVKKHETVKPSGHYEKRVKEITQYVYVNGKEPSGIPGAFVVTENEAKGELSE